VLFQTPPSAAPANTVRPSGRTASAVMRPVVSPAPAPELLLTGSMYRGSSDCMLYGPISVQAPVVAVRTRDAYAAAAR
jgi:hypothetical protein